MVTTDAKFETHEYAIGGKMVVGRATMSESYRMMMDNNDQKAIDAVKSQLINQMAQFILENKLVEFAYQDDPITFQRQIAVRAYLAPDNQVKILRVAHKC